MSQRPKPIQSASSDKITELQQTLGGRFQSDLLTRKLYATDASEYQELPLAVAFPESETDVAALIRFASRTRTSLIPTTAGTSLAGQVVGSGIVLDCGRHLHKIVSLDVEAESAGIDLPERCGVGNPC